MSKRDEFVNGIKFDVPTINNVPGSNNADNNNNNDDDMNPVQEREIGSTVNPQPVKNEDEEIVLETETEEEAPFLPGFNEIDFDDEEIDIDDDEIDENDDPSIEEEGGYEVEEGEEEGPSLDDDDGEER